jgi:hypothetical protein
VSASLAPTEVMGSYVDVASSVSAYLGLGRGTRNASEFDFELVWCGLTSCPSFLQATNIDFSYYQANPAKTPPTITLTSAQQNIVQLNALNALRAAFANYKVNTGVGHQGTNTVYVVGEYPAAQNGSIPCSDTNPFSHKESRNYYLVNMEQAQWALNLKTGQPPPSLVQATGEGLGNNAAHEIAHQLNNDTRFAFKVVGGLGLDDSSIGTYNAATCAGLDAPWVYTGVGTDGVTPIFWETNNAAQSLTNILGNKAPF